MSTPTKLFEPFKLGPITLPNRLVMAPLTRNRAVAGLVPSPLAIEYYGQRASAGLLITEASQVSQQGQGYQDTPGIYSKEQVAGWRKVTDRVHDRGGRIIIQLWHVGRISHTSLQPNGGAPVAPSAIRANGKTFVGGTFTEISEPRALALEEIPGIVESFKRGAANALEAGFDGVEIHGANGYLLDQFANNGYDFELATKVLAANQADLIAFGKPFISNPDLVERLKRGAALTPPDKATFYGGGAKGYTDYPALGEVLDAAQ